MNIISTSGIIRPTPIAWAESGTHVAVPFGRLLHIYDVTGSSPRRVATANDHQASISAVVALPGMKFASASEDATVRIWDAVDGECIRTIDIARPVFDLRIIHDSLLCLTRDGLCQIFYTQPYHFNLVFRCHLSLKARLSSSSDASVVAIIEGKNLSLVFQPVLHPREKQKMDMDMSDIDDKQNDSTPSADRKRKEKVLSMEVSFRKALSAVAVSASASHLAIADVDGVIFHVRDPFRLRTEAQPKPTVRSFVAIRPTKLHWHFAPVQSLTFTHGDSTLLSCGQEAVLVSWTVRSFNFGMKNFLPRLSAPVIALSVSPDEAMYAISMSDNSVTLLRQNTQMPSAVIRSIACRINLDADRALDKYKSLLGLAVCSSTTPGCIFIANDNTRIQEFNAVRGEHVANMSVVPMNEVFSSKRGLETMTPTRVTHVATHPNGNFLATIDHTRRYTDVKFRLETRVEQITTLRIWRRNTRSEWIPCAVVVNPHGLNNNVLFLTFHPVLNILLTTGSDCQFKLWRATMSYRREGVEKSGTWRCELTQSYRQQLCRCACFSSDGSILALGTGSVVALYKMIDLSEDEDIAFQSDGTIQLDFSHLLVNVPADERVQSVQFVQSGVPLFVAITRKGVYVWNVLAQTVWWSFAADCSLSTLTVDPDSGRFAVVVRIASFVSGTDNSEVIEDEQPPKRRNGHNKHRKESTEDVEDKMMLSSDDEDKDEEDRNDSAEILNYDNNAGDNGTEETKKKTPRRGRRGVWEGHNKELRRLEKAKHLQKKQYGVAIFESSSPVPIHVHQLAPGVSVSSLTFVKTSTKDEKILGDNNSALVCIDDNLEISLLQGNGDINIEFSMTSDEPLSTETNGQERVMTSKIDELLGENWRNDTVSRTSNPVNADEGNEESNVWKNQMSQVFDEHFAGPMHVQAPVGVQSFEFMKSLLIYSGEQEAKEEQSGEDTEQPANHSNSKGEPLKDATENVEEAVTDEKLDWWFDDKDQMGTKEMRTFCKRILAATARSTEDPKLESTEASKSSLRSSKSPRSRKASKLVRSSSGRGNRSPMVTERSPQRNSESNSTERSSSFNSGRRSPRSPRSSSVRTSRSPSALSRKIRQRRNSLVQTPTKT